MRSRWALVLLAACSLVTLVSCGDEDDGTDGGATAVLSPTVAVSMTPVDATTVSTPTPVPGGPNEGGQSPIFWRTADDFASVVAGQPYTVLFRITSGYDEDALTVVASCDSCPAGEPGLSFEGMNSPPFPAGSDLPGSYYPMNIVLPRAGEWTIVVQAGPDEVSIPVTVVEAQRYGAPSAGPQ